MKEEACPFNANANLVCKRTASAEQDPTDQRTALWHTQMLKAQRVADRTDCS
jgi:hypothetical protein